MQPLNREIPQQGGLWGQHEGQLRGNWNVTEQGFKLRSAGLEGPQSLMLTAKREFEI